MRTLIVTLSLVASSLVVGGCKSSGVASTPGEGDPTPIPTGEAMYTRTGMHFDTKDGKYVMYSTNYVGLNKYLPPGTRLTYEGTSRNSLTFKDDDGSSYVIEFVPKHSLMSLAEWQAQQFSTAPEALPDGLTDDERAAIAEGVARPGMSRQAVLLALGHPPKALSPSEKDTVLTYERKRFVRYTVRFGADDKVVDLSR